MVLLSKSGGERDAHSDGMALLVVDVAVVSLIPFVHVLVETIEPVGCGGEICNTLCWDIARDERGNWMADEHIGELNVLPQELPNIILWGSFLYSEVSADLDVTSVEDWSIGSQFLDQRN